MKQIPSWLMVSHQRFERPGGGVTQDQGGSMIDKFCGRQERENCVKDQENKGEQQGVSMYGTGGERND